MSMGTFNKRKLMSVAEYATKQDWDTVLPEVLATGTVWLGDEDNQKAVTYTQRAAILLRGQALRSWC